MKFEQAFYTRGKNLLNQAEGLGIAASSRQDETFLNICMSLGSKINRERSSVTSEIVLYSDRVQGYVGIGISPAFNNDGGNVNKLCHLFVPVEGSLDPDECFVDYKFRQAVEKGEFLTQVTIEPCLHKENLREILEKYGFGKDKLAYFLWKLYPVLFGEKNMLAVVLDETACQHYDVSVLAREMTWMAAYLIPTIGEKEKDYRKYLSYAVNSTENYAIANIAYVTEDYGISNRFFFNGRTDDEVPEVYYVIAEKMLQSYEVLQKFFGELRELSEKMQDRNIGLSQLQELFFVWKLNHDCEIHIEDIPLRLDSISRTAVGEEFRKQMLYGIVKKCEQFGDINAAVVWKNYIMNLPEGSQRWEEEQTEELAEQLLSLMYEGNNGIYITMCKELSEKRPEICRRLMRNVFAKEDSCIRRHLRNVTDGDSLFRILQVYDLLSKETDFQNEVANIAAGCYFSMNLELRKRFRQYFNENGNSSWSEKVDSLIKKKVEAQDGFMFLEKEMGNMEPDCISQYISCFLDQCSTLENSELRQQAEKIGDSYVEQYRNYMYGEDLERYDQLKEKWRNEELKKEIQEKPLEEVLDISPKSMDQDLKELWCKEIECRIKKGEWNQTILDKFLKKAKVFVRDLSQDLMDKLENVIWAACGDKLEWRIQCSMAFGVEKFSIWSRIQAGDLEMYEKIRSLLVQDRKRIMDRSLASEKMKQADFSRRCFVLWYKLVVDHNINVSFECIPGDDITSICRMTSKIKQQLLLTDEPYAVAGYYVLCLIEEQARGENKGIDWYCRDLLDIREKYPEFYHEFFELEFKQTSQKDRVVQIFNGLKIYAEFCDRKKEYDMPALKQLYSRAGKSVLKGSKAEEEIAQMIQKRTRKEDVHKNFQFPRIERPEHNDTEGEDRFNHQNRNEEYIRSLREENACLKAGNDRITEENARLKAENDRITEENARLKAENDRIQKENEWLRTEKQEPMWGEENTNPFKTRRQEQINQIYENVDF